jgi:hypothetical protein
MDATDPTANRWSETNRLFVTVVVIDGVVLLVSAA